MSFFRHLIGFIAEMTMQPDPYARYEAPKLVSEKRDGRGRVVQQTIRADNQADATRHLQGTTIQGNRSIVATKIAPKTWEVHIEDWDTGK